MRRGQPRSQGLSSSRPQLQGAGRGETLGTRLTDYACEMSNHLYSSLGWHVITKCDSYFYYKCDRYYKVRRLYYKVQQVFTKFDDYYRVRQRNDPDVLISLPYCNALAFVFDYHVVIHVVSELVNM